MERRLTGMIAAAAVLIVLFVFWDIFRPTPRAIEQPAEPLRSSADAQNPVAPPVAPPAPPTGPAAPADRQRGGGGARDPDRSQRTPAVVLRAARAVGDTPAHSRERREHESGRHARSQRRFDAAAR